MNLTEKYLGEASKSNLRSVVSEMKEIYKRLEYIKRNLEAVDNSIGGTSIIDDIKKDHQKLLKALDKFTGTLGSAVPEYEKMLR